MSNDPKLLELSQDGNFRGKVDAVIDELAAHGTQSHIISALRTLEQQREKVRLGYSHTMQSEHLPHGADNLSFGADVIPAESGYQAPQWYWLLQAHIAMGHGLGVGILFGLHGPAFANLVKFFTDTSVPFDPKAWDGPTGWDKSHLQKDRNW